MKYSSYVEKQIELNLRPALEAMQKLAEEIREKKLLPFCKRKRYTYLSGNGTFSFYDRNGNVVDMDRTAELRRLKDLLDLPVLSRDDVIGFYVLDILEKDIH